MNHGPFLFDHRQSFIFLFAKSVKLSYLQQHGYFNDF